MAQPTVADFSTTPASNTDFSGVGVLGTSLVSTADDAFRTLASMLKSGVQTGYATVATAAGTTVLTANSNSYQYATGVTTQTYTMPVTSTLELGRAFTFVNNSTGALTINSSGGNLIATVLAGATLSVQCILLTGTTAASWNVLGLNGGFANGTAANPSITFASDPDTGIYRPAANQVGIGTNGTGLVIFDQPNATVRPLTNGGFTLGDATHLIGGLYLQQNAGAFVGWGGTGPLIFNTSGNILTFAVGASYSFDALIDLSSGATTVGVKFPAVQIVSANANTLDDYAEGTTTPTITSGSGTFTTVSCTLTYTKTGNRVVWDAVITITTNGSAAGSIILPLPFTTGAASAASGVVVSSGVTVGGHVPVSSTTLTIRKYDGTYPGADGLTIRLGGSFRV